VSGIGWLSALWAVPIVGAAVVILLPTKQFARYLALAVSLGVLAIALVLAVRFEPGGPQFQFVEDHQWIPSFGTGYVLGVDGIALALVVLTAVLVPLLLVAGWHTGDSDTGLRTRSTQSYLALTLPSTCCCSTCSSRRCSSRCTSSSAGSVASTAVRPR
jgi:NADH-quinone oxidoreductase subunit M